MKKLILFITLIALIFSIYVFSKNIGNVFYMSYALKTTIRICETEYGGRLTAKSYYFDGKNQRYVVAVIDVNGVESDIAFTALSGIQNNYAEQSNAVARNTLRGKFQKLLRDNAIESASCFISSVNTIGSIIGEDNAVCTELNVIIENIDGKEDMAEKILNISSAVSDRQYERLRVICKTENDIFEFDSPKEGISKKANDIIRQITPVTI